MIKNSISYKSHLKWWLLFCLIVIAGVSCGLQFSTVEWTMIDVNSGRLQADAHLLKFPDGQMYMIDTGDPYNQLVPFLKEQHIEVIHKLFLSHFHKDHYGGLPAILNSDISVQEIYINMPDREACEREIPWGCDYPHIIKIIELMKSRNIRVSSVKAGDVFYNKEGIRLEALYAYDGADTPVGQTDINDTSIIMSLRYGRTRVLFTGDLNRPMGTWLAKNDRQLESDILKVPHHGAESAAPNAFFDAVNPQVALVPSPKSLWLSNRSKRIKDYFDARMIDTYVNGIHGHITVLLFEDRFIIVNGAKRKEYSSRN